MDISSPSALTPAPVELSPLDAFLGPLEAVRPKHRRTKQTKAAKARVLAAYIACGDVEGACRRCQVHNSTFYLWKKRDPVFAAAVLEAEERAIDVVEGSLFHQAIKRRNISASLAILTRRRRAKWGDDDPSVPSTSPQPVVTINAPTLNVAQLSDEGLAVYKRLLEEVRALRLQEAVSTRPVIDGKVG